MSTYTKEWLKENGYDGLYYPGECGCENNDLAPCGEDPGGDCRPGYRHYDPRPKHKGDWAVFGKKETPDLDAWNMAGHN